MAEKAIIIEQSFDASVERVWDAITNLNEMKQWFFSNIEFFEPVLGFETRFVIQVEDRVFPHLWKLTEVVPFKKITYDWSYEGYAGRSMVTFELFEEGDHTKLSLTSSTVEKYPNHIPEFSRESGVEGWNYFICKSLKAYLDN